MGTNEIQNLLIPLTRGEDLTREEIMRAFQIILHGGATPAQMGAFLMGLRQKGESVEEITGAALAMRGKMQTLNAPADAIDTCGTGGDAKGTLNISTAVAIVAAACGVPVAKHGNRAITSASGSSDVLRALNVNIDATIPQMEQALSECNLCFMMAPRFHPMTRHIAPVRIELGLRTIFNFLGPLTNPAGVKRQVIGVFSADWQEPIAEALRNLGCDHAWVVHGSDGLDELTTTGPSTVTELKGGLIHNFEIHPESLGLEMVPLDALKGGDASHNAQAIHRLLSGEPGPYRDIVLLNTAACLIVAGKASELKDGMRLAAEAVDSGKAKETLAKLVAITTQIISHEHAG